MSWQVESSIFLGASTRTDKGFKTRASLASGVRSTISWGTAAWRRGDSAASLMRRAARARYRMKRRREAAAAAG